MAYAEYYYTFCVILVLYKERSMGFLHAILFLRNIHYSIGLLHTKDVCVCDIYSLTESDSTDSGCVLHDI